MEEHPLFFNGWDSLGRVALVAAISYFTLVVLLRITGKKAVSKMNIFDLVFVIALGDVYANGVTDKSVTYLEAMCGIGVLLLIRFVLQRIAKRWDGFEKFL